MRGICEGKRAGESRGICRGKHGKNPRLNRRNQEGSDISGEARFGGEEEEGDVGVTAAVGGDADMRVPHVSGRKKN